MNGFGIVGTILSLLNAALGSSGASLLGSRMRSVCLIDTYMFETRDIDSIRHKLSIGWTDIQRVGNHPKTQRIGKWTEEIEISGRLIVKSVHSLSSFESISKRGSPVRLTLGTGESFRVTVREVERTKTDFVKSGHFVKQDYKIILQRYWS